MLLLWGLIVPGVFYFSTGLRRHAIFWHKSNDYKMKYLDPPEKFGMTCTNNIYFNMSDGARIGVWEMASPMNECKMYKGKKPLILFLHGNAGSRRSPVRIEKYRMFMDMGMDVVTLDYRGYGDSSGYPSAEHTFEDVITVYNHVRENKRAHEIIVWGHSLGTGIATKFVSRLNETVGGLVLETPFDRVGNVLFYHKLTALLRKLPFFKYIYVDRINNDPEVCFNSVDYVKLINPKLPLYIFATEDDKVVPAVLAKNLYNELVKFRNSTKNSFIKVFDSKFQFGHLLVHRSPETTQIIEEFLKICCKPLF